MTIEVVGSNIQTINSLPNKFQLPSQVIGYRCNNESCRQKDTTAKMDLITETSQMLIIQLSLFRYINGAVLKVTPDLHIDDEITVCGVWSLHGIIFHEGRSANSEHYTCSVKVNGEWFTANDMSILKEEPKLECRVNAVN